MTVKKRYLYVFVLFLIFSGSVIPLLAESVIATTSWTASFAMAAGAEKVEVLAPAEMMHPSEYELTPEDILKLKRADLIIYAGYEVMIKAIKNNLNIPEDKMLKIETRHDPAAIETSLRKIGIRLGTESVAERNINEITDLISSARDEFSSLNIEQHGTLVHFFQRPLAGSLGIDPSFVFGPQPLTIMEISKAKKQGVTLIIDNYHNPVSMPLLSVLPEARTVIWRNFPERISSSSLKDVIEENITMLRELYQE